MWYFRWGTPILHNVATDYIWGNSLVPTLLMMVTNELCTWLSTDQWFRMQWNETYVHLILKGKKFFQPSSIGGKQTARTLRGHLLNGQYTRERISHSWWTRWLHDVLLIRCDHIWFCSWNVSFARWWNFQCTKVAIAIATIFIENHSIMKITEYCSSTRELAKWSNLHRWNWSEKR